VVSCDAGTAPHIKGAAMERQDYARGTHRWMEVQPVPPTAESLSLPAITTRRLRANPSALSTVSATGALAILDAASGRFYTLNDVGARVWDLLRDGAMLSTIVNELQREYDVPADVLRADIERLLSQLANAGLISSE
jgi:PqqD family protein of HPr-rel-A system